MFLALEINHETLEVVAHHNGFSSCGCYNFNAIA